MKFSFLFKTLVIEIEICLSNNCICQSYLFQEDNIKCSFRIPNVFLSRKLSLFFVKMFLQLLFPPVIAIILWLPSTTVFFNHATEYFKVNRIYMWYSVPYIRKLVSSFMTGGEGCMLVVLKCTIIKHLISPGLQTFIYLYNTQFSNITTKLKVTGGFMLKYSNFLHCYGKTRILRRNNKVRTFHSASLPCFIQDRRYRII